MIDPLKNWSVLVALEMSLFVVFFCCCIITLGSLSYLLSGAREREREGDVLRGWGTWGMEVNSVCDRTGREV